LKLFNKNRKIAKKMSRPSRARGLKQNQHAHLSHTRQVAPLAGAWIETSLNMLNLRTSSSRPSRARGLKLVAAEFGFS